MILYLTQRHHESKLRSGGSFRAGRITDHNVKLISNKSKHKLMQLNRGKIVSHLLLSQGSRADRQCDTG